MQTKNLIILSDFNLFYGIEAGVSRMNNYAKAITRSEMVNVYLVSSLNFREKEEMIQCGEGIYTSVEKKNVIESKGFRRVWDNFVFAIKVKRWLKKLNNDAVVLLYPSANSSFEFFLVLLLKILSSHKLFCEINEVRKTASFLNIFSFSSTIRWFTKYLSFTINELFWSFYDGLVCISSNIESYARKYNKNTIIVPILSDFDGQKFTFNPPKNGFVILFTGWIFLKKENLIEFLLALVELNELHSEWIFNLCGNIQLADKKNLDEFIINHKIDSKVHYLGVVSHIEAIEMQRNASLLVLPRDNQKQNYYGFSTKLSEYAVSGTPILMTDTGVVSDFFSDNFNCYMVDGYSHQGFYNKLLTAFSAESSEHERIARNAYNTAHKSFAYFRYTEVLNDFFKLKK